MMAFFGWIFLWVGSLGANSDSMHYPTDLLLLDDGRPVVLDGVHGRLAFYSPTGQFDRYVKPTGKGALDHPLGFCRGPEGGIVVADTGNGRLQFYDKEGKFRRSVGLGDLLDRPRLTGVCPDQTGQRLFLTDSRNHAVHLLRLDDFTRIWSLSLPAWNGVPAYPLSPLWVDGVLYVVEPLSGRVRQIDGDGRVLRTLGGLGLGPGHLYRPRDLAVNGEGQLLVSDLWQGTVSLFDPQGVFCGFAHPRRFKGPWGVAVDQERQLWVVEMGVQALSRYLLPETADPKQIIPSQAEAGTWIEPGMETCILCHPEPFSSSRPDPAGEAKFCLTCHDGSVVDSRATAFAVHGHSGLTDPGLNCLTCHQAHGPEETHVELSEAVFLRFPGSGDGICLRCHGLEADGRSNLLHTDTLPRGAVPESLVRLGAAPPRGEDRNIQCRSCHRPHGFASNQLLVGGSFGPCRICHESVDHGGESHAESGLLRCWDCHLIHEKAGQEQTTRGCADCHEEITRVVSLSAHGLEEEGGCLRCHESLRDGGIPRLDGLSDCLQCHTKELGQSPHLAEPLPCAPRLLCISCHDPHRGDRTGLLRPGSAEQLCAPCHGPQSLYYFLNFHQQRNLPRSPEPSKP